jgi:hypothetical protein
MCCLWTTGSATSSSPTSSAKSPKSNTPKNPTSDIPWPERREQLKGSYRISESLLRRLERTEQAYFDAAVAAVEIRRNFTGISWVDRGFGPYSCAWACMMALRRWGDDGGEEGDERVVL